METIEQRIALIRDDREHGSRWLVREAIMLLHDMATMPDAQLERIRHVGQELAHARPAMAALAGAVGRILHTADDQDSVAHAAAQLLEEYAVAVERITDHARPLLIGTVMTHSLSGTVLEVLLACRTQIERVIVLEGRPRYEGRDVARALSQQGIPVTLITEAQAALFLPACRAVVVGADTVLENGAVLNKAGTALVAWAARGLHVPFYVLCETLKIAPHLWTGDFGQLEEKEPEEVLAHPMAGVTVRNFYFDHTPAELVTGVITEQGLVKGEQIGRIAAMVAMGDQA